jgi:hypothetical protein
MKSMMSLTLVIAVAIAPMLSAQELRGSWAQVQAIAPGTEVIVTQKGGATQKRVFIAADAAEASLLNVVDPPLEPAAKYMLLELARQPERFLAQIQGAAVEGDQKGARIGASIVSFQSRMT